jgi:hypothetical protein
MFISLNLVDGRVTQEFGLYYKSIDSKLMIAMLLLLSMVLSGKTYSINFSDFKSMKTAKDWFPENTGERFVNMKPPLGVLTNKKKQRKIMIAGTKAKTV